MTCCQCFAHLQIDPAIPATMRAMRFGRDPERQVLNPDQWRLAFMVSVMVRVGKQRLCAPADDLSIEGATNESSLERAGCGVAGCIWAAVRLP